MKLIFLHFWDSVLGFAGFLVWWFLVLVKPLYCLVVRPFWTDFRDLKNLLDGTENCFWSAAWWIRGHKQNGRRPLSGCILTLYKDEMSEVPAALCRRSFGVRALAIGSTFPLTTRVFSLLLHPSAPNSWMCTSLTTTSNKKQVFRFSVYRKSRNWIGRVYVSCSLPQEGLTSIVLFHSFHEGVVLRPQLAVTGFHLPNARPVIISAYNRTHQKTLAPPVIHLPILHHMEQRMGTVAKRSFLSLNKGHLVG